MVALLLTAACTATRPAHQASAPSIPTDWQTLQDTTYGYSLRYPPGWTEKFAEPAGFHALASRADMASLLELQNSDYWLVAQASASDPSGACGDGVAGPAEKSATTLGGQTATRYLVTGTQGGRSQHVMDITAHRGDTCYTLQLVAGSAIPLDRALATLQEIQSTYRFGR